MNRTVGIVVGMLIVLVLVLYNTTYTVNFHEVAVVTRFGKPAGVVREPGLHLKAPFFVDQVTRLDTRQQLIESPLETVMTRDGQQVLVQAFMTWRIDTDPDATLRFFTSYASVDGAAKELETQLQGALRAIGGYAFSDLVGQGSKLGEAESAILEDLKRTRLAGTMPVSATAKPPRPSSSKRAAMPTSSALAASTSAAVSVPASRFWASEPISRVRGDSAPLLWGVGAAERGRRVSSVMRDPFLKGDPVNPYREPYGHQTGALTHTSHAPCWFETRRGSVADSYADSPVSRNDVMGTPDATRACSELITYRQ